MKNLDSLTIEQKIEVIREYRQKVLSKEIDIERPWLREITINALETIQTLLNDPNRQKGPEFERLINDFMEHLMNVPENYAGCTSSPSPSM